MSISVSFLKFPIFYLLLLVLLLLINFCPNICQNSIQTTTKGFLRYSHHSFSSTQYESASRRQHDEDHKTLIIDFNAVRPTSAQFLVVESPDQNNKYKKIYPIRSQIPSQLIPSVEEETDLESSTSVSCSNNKNFTQNSTYQIHLTTLLSSLSSTATTGNTRFHNATVTGNATDTVYGLYICERDTPRRTCRQCVDSAIQVASSECRWSKEAIIWINGGACMVRYSNRSFFSELETRPRIVVDTEAEIAPKQRERLGEKVEAVLEEVVEALEVKGTIMKFARKKVGVEWDELLTIESVGECTWDLSTQDCSKCLRGVLWDIKSCCIGKQGGGVMYPTCFLRFQLKKDRAPPTRKAKGESWIIIIVVVFIVVFVLLSCFALYISRREKSKSYKAILREYFGSEGATLKSLHFSLATIENATNNFSHENKIGKGGYGEVYKGILLDGREIAVKRLSTNSGQGVVEFKNEVLLITKLQHRNLVTLLGFCLKKQEKILIYEYVPNKSLDYFLFGPQEREALNWSDRYKIIGGIALGILYLHEHSRLKVIHRDLKPSNILLDNQMNPKISDFGMAKLVDITESEGCTNRIVGTYGYMSPEYVMFGQFSEKSDVFSFGVMILEIVSGKRNNAASCHESQYNQGLLSYAWKQWREKNLLEMMDSNMTKLGSNREVIAKCIHIGLLCVQANPNARPSMGTIVQYLSNDSIDYDLPFPQEPAFFSYGQMEPTIGSIMKSGFGDQHPNCSKSCSDSVNEMSHSDFFPR